MSCRICAVRPYRHLGVDRVGIHADIVQAVSVEHGADRQWLVVGLGFAQVAKQLFPAADAGVGGEGGFLACS